MTTQNEQFEAWYLTFDYETQDYPGRIKNIARNVWRAAQAQQAIEHVAERMPEKLYTTPPDTRAAMRWAVQKWKDEVLNRPMINVHRRSLDDTWRQVIRHFGGNPDELVGPSHSALLAANPIRHATTSPQEDAMKDQT